MTFKKKSEQPESSPPAPLEVEGAPESKDADALPLTSQSMPEAKAPAPKAAPAQKTGLVLCVVHGGSYQDDKLYQVGDECLVPVEELERLAHCLKPVE